MAALFDRMIKQIPKVCSTDAQLFMRHYYETHLGIFDHDHFERDNPLSLIAHRPAEETGGLLLERARDFEDRNIGARWNCSFQEFLSYPRHLVEFMLDLSLKRMQEKNTVDAANARKLAELGMGGNS